MLLAILFVVFTSFSNADLSLHDDNDMTSEYAEVRNLLNEYHKLVARRHGFYNDYDAQHVNTALQNTSFDDGTEASTNRREGVAGDLFENDILLTLPQAKALLKEVGKSEHAYQLYFNTLQGNANVPRFSILACEDCRTMPWRTDRLSTKYSSFVVQAVGQALDGSEDANRSQLDMAAMRSVSVRISSIGVIAHETLHALGLWHEQSRSDRDRYIAINYRNVYPGTEGNFEKRSTRTTENMGEPYDLGSVMHYGSKAFAVDYSREYSDRPLARDRLGLPAAPLYLPLREIDHTHVSIAVRAAPDSCKRQLPCQNGGYTNPNRCNQCKCPQGYGGQYCLSVEESGKD
ncbi:Zinc metalloproteinase nas-37 [Toxocara canis]|uniref:Metalloendopeptidase n=1 Tax=Toxocara canis TaxID=6265 RepID=A0A0B2VYZ2_TOXCA|nr:Zinc metalloproteinase nas-37 [Toxocara canis]